MKTLFALFFLLTGINTYSQLDYSEARLSIDPSLLTCGIKDTITLKALYAKLLDFDTTTISKNIAEYYEDLASVEYELFMWTQDTSYLRMSSVNDVKAASFGPNNSAEWNAAFSFALTGDCPKMREYLFKYHKSGRKKDIRHNKDQIEYLLELCPDEELKKLFRL